MYNLVNSLPAFHDPNIKSLQTAWQEEKEILRKGIELLNEEAVSKPVSSTSILHNKLYIAEPDTLSHITV